MVSSLTEMVQLLYKNREILIVDRPDDWETAADSKDLGERINLNDSIMDLLRKELEKNTLRSYQDPKALTKTLTSLYRSARLSIEESGANTLYIALGFLKWFEPGKSLPHFATIVNIEGLVAILEAIDAIYRLGGNSSRRGLSA